MAEQRKPYRITGRPQTIFRTVKNAENPYVVIDRRPIGNAKMSYKAKGILTYLMSRPDGWEVSVADLINHSTDGEASVRSGLKELKNAGHMKYTKIRAGGRITGWLIEVFEHPQLSPDGDFQDVEKPHVENRTQVLKNLSINDLDVNERVALLATLYESNITMLNGMSRDMIVEAAKEYTDKSWYTDAFKIAVENNIRKWNYVETILRNWKEKGRDWKPTKPNSKRQQRTQPAPVLQFDAQGNLIL